jgi:2-polyprenyl-3-methyl-5-hydroxy-6-metoxy-1,4-benzoquinol methylase
MALIGLLARRRKGERIVPSIDELPETQFHAVTLFEVLEHLDAPISVLRSLRELLVLGGVLVLETPDCSGITTIVSERDYRNIHPLDHINAFTPATLCSIASRAGFRSIRRPVSYVTADTLKLLKRATSAIVPTRHSTQQYFVKT